MSKQYTLDDVRNQVGNYVPSPTTVSPDDWEQIRPFVTETVLKLFGYADSNNLSPKLSKDNVGNYLTYLTAHCARVHAHTGTVHSEDMFTAETIAWSLEQEYLSNGTKTERKRILTRAGKLLSEIDAEQWNLRSRNHAETQVKPYAPQEVLKIIDWLDAQGTSLKNECVRVAVTLALAGITAPDINQVRARDVYDGFPVTVTVDERTHAIIPSLSEKFLEIVNQREPDEFVFCPSRARKVQNVTEYMNRFKRGPGMGDVSVRRLVATWRNNLIERGISKEAFLALTGVNRNIYSHHAVNAPLREVALLETVAVTTELFLTGEAMLDERMRNSSASGSTAHNRTGLEVIEGGRK